MYVAMHITLAQIISNWSSHCSNCNVWCKYILILWHTIQIVIVYCYHCSFGFFLLFQILINCVVFLIFVFYCSVCITNVNLVEVSFSGESFNGTPFTACISWQFLNICAFETVMKSNSMTKHILFQHRDSTIISLALDHMSITACILLSTKRVYVTQVLCEISSKQNIMSCDHLCFQ